MNYSPIDCNLHSYLEHFATLNSRVCLHFTQHGTVQVIEDIIIEDLFTKNKEEFITLSNKSVVRLDQITKLNEIDFRPPSSCSI